VKNRRTKTDWRWMWSFCLSIEITESIWCTRIGTVLPKLMWNSLPKATCSSFSSCWHRMFNGTSTSTTLRFGTRDDTFFKKADSSFFDGDEMLTVMIILMIIFSLERCLSKNSFNSSIQILKLCGFKGYIWGLENFFGRRKNMKVSTQDKRDRRS